MRVISNWWRMIAGLCVVSIQVVAAAHVAADDWVSFRNGGGSRTAGAALPVTWSKEKGIGWQKELPGYGQSTPVIWKGVVYVTAVDGPHKERCLVLAMEAKTGQPLWRHEFPASTGLPSNYMAARAAPTPAVDASGVYVFFEGGDIAALAHNGTELWRRSLTTEYGAFQNHHGLGSSIAQDDDSLYLHIQHSGPSYLLCVDKKTGTNRWKADRKSSMSWSTPVVLEDGGRRMVVVSSGGEVEAFDARMGTVCWRAGEFAGNATPSPTIDGKDLLLGAALSDFESASNVSKSNACLTWQDGKFSVRWRAQRAMCDYASPVVCGSYVYYVNRLGVVYCLNRADGAELYSHRLPGPCWATPVVSGDRVFFFGKDGVTTVIEAASEWREVARNSLWDGENPPKPESYVETQGGPHGAERGGTEAAKAGGPANPAPAKGAAPGARPAGGGPPGGGGLAQSLLAHDKNGDGRLDASELPENFQRMLKSGDKNSDNALDKDEIAALAEEFRKRREGVKDQSRDPIVYGVAAADGMILIRTGTRLYCVTP